MRGLYEAWAFISSTIELILSSSCVICGARGALATPICEGCQSSFTLIEAHCCKVCGRPFGNESVVAHSEGFLCGECRPKKHRWYFDRAFSTFIYDEKMRAAILAFKYKKRFSIGDVLGGLWAPLLSRHIADLEDSDERSRPDLVLPVPLHRKRLRSREFNQAAILARFSGIALGRPVAYDVLARIRDTEYQSRLSPVQKIKNVKGAFKVTEPKVIEDLNVLLIDDIFTTGATVNECAKMMKKAGAASVIVATLKANARSGR